MPPRLTRLRNPRCLLPIAILLALFIPFSLVLVWTHGVPSSSTILPLIGLGTSSSSEKEEGGWGWDEGPSMGGVQNLESLGYTGAPDALDRFPANVPAPDIVKALKGARWAGGWGVVRVNPGLECGVVKDGVKDDGAAGSGSGQGDEGESGGAEESAGDAAYEMDEDGLPSMREAVTERNAGYDLSNDTIPSLNPYHPTFRRSYRKPRSPLSASISPSNSYFDSLAQKPPHAAFLQLHFFSRPTHTTAPRTRRDLIRRTIFTGVPRRLRRFIDVRFVVAHAWDPALETVLKVEEERYGDLIRVGVPDPGSERGLGVRWVEEVVGAAEKGEGGGREGVWVVKCSDNVLPILPNLIPYLLAQNPSVPTYFGSSLLTDARQPAYFDDHMFGFTLGVLKTLAAANLSDEVKDKAISTGLLFGELMYSLPDQPTLPTRQDQEPHHLAANPTSQSTTLVSHAPASPDPRTGLIYLDAGRLIAPFQSPYGAPGDRALGWYDIADDRAYEFDALEQAIRDVRAKGRRFRWDAPGWMEDVVRACEAVGR